MVWAILAAVFAVLSAVLAVRLLIWRHAAREMVAQLQEFVKTDTNSTLTLSTTDRRMQALAVELNKQLRALRTERRRLQCGDQELRDAVTNISHDLRTPLTAICGYLDMLEGEERTVAATAYLERIRERTEALKTLTEELFRYSVILSQGEKLNLTPVSLGRALEESLAAAYGALHTKGIEPKVLMPDGEVIRRLDGEALGRVFGNILNNVLKYSDRELTVRLTEQGEVVFSNPAPGLNETAVGKMFDRFFTVETGRASVGVGLSIAKMLTERMGGRITATLNDGILSIHLLF